MHFSIIVLILSITASLQTVSAAPLVTETKFELAKRQCPPGTAPGPPPPPPPVFSPAECYKATQNIACYQPPPPPPPPAKSGPKSGNIGLPDLSCYVLPAASLPGFPAPPVTPPLPAATLPDLSTFVIPSLPGVPELPALPGLPVLPGLPALGGD